MSPILAPDAPEEDWLALEYALGVLELSERRQAQARIERDPAFSAEVDAWTARLAPFIDEIAGVEPSPALWARIHAASGGGEVVDLAARRVAARESAERVNRGLSRWRGATVAAVAVAVLLAVVAVSLILPRPKPPVAGPPPLLMAELETTKGQGYWAAVYDPTRRRIVLQLPAGAARVGRSAELWLIGADGKPRALGVAPRDGALATLVVPQSAVARLVPSVVLAVSIEPLGGSPTGSPTGAVVAKGALRPA